MIVNGGGHVYQVLKYINDNIDKKLTTEETSALFGYSKWYFCKKFHKCTNMTFNEYVRRYRIQLAAVDILQGKKVTDVAYSYGYESIGGFNKAFFKEYECLPREYRKRARESQLSYEMRKLSMYRLSERCSILREEAVELKNNQKNYCLQRNVYFAIGGAEAAEKGLELSEVFASAITNVIKSFKPYIAPGELIVGFNYGDGTTDDGYVPENTPKDIELMKSSRLSDLDIEKFFSMDPYYRSPSFIYGFNLNDGKEELSKAEVEAKVERASIGKCICHNHSVLDYEKVLKLGFEGVYKEAERYERKNGSSPLYRGMKKICLAAMEIGEKYAAEAQRLLDENAADYEKEDLKTIISVCSKMPRKPAESFVEAVQSLWFAHIINTWEDTINANSLGRLDQILYPYYKADIEKGIITNDEVFEIICCLWLKLYRDYDVQQCSVGGTSPNGKSDVNELSYIMLDATECLDFVRCISVRYSGATETAFLKRALEVVGHVQKGIPAFFNDDVIIPALISKSIKKEDAYNYTQLGCVETLIPGKTNPHAVTGEMNLLKSVEYVMGNGYSLMHPEFMPGMQTGDIKKLDSYKKFYQAVLTQIDRILDLTCSQVKICSDMCISPKPYKSLLTEGCMESGKDYNSGGAVYDYYQIMIGGLPNLADSLAAIKKLVYEDRKYTLEELKNIIVNNYPDEDVRMEFINKAPKFGNDIDEVDNIAADVINHICDELEALSGKYGLSFHPQLFTFLWMIENGNECAASPDGRRAGEAIAYSVSPMQGRDFKGLTAVLNSIVKLPTKRIPGTTAAIVEVDPRLFIDKNLNTIADVLMESGKKGLSNIQFSTVDADTLIEASKRPEEYTDLTVQVSGFSQKFNLLTPELQEYIIRRTKHEYF